MQGNTVINESVFVEIARKLCRKWKMSLNRIKGWFIRNYKDFYR